MSSRVTRSTTEQTEVANILLSLSRAENPVAKKKIIRGDPRKFWSMLTWKQYQDTMILRDRSKLKSPTKLMF